MLTVGHICHRLRSEGIGMHFRVEFDFLVKTCTVQGSLYVFKDLAAVFDRDRMYCNGYPFPTFTK
jgi:hypothetical protein